MRGLFAFLLGVIVTIGGAYVHDSAVVAPGQRFVNWEVLGDSARTVIDAARAQWEHWRSR